MIAALGIIYFIAVAVLVASFFYGAGRNRDYDLNEQATILETMQ
jgi:hypothetical protein